MAKITLTFEDVPGENGEDELTITADIQARDDDKLTPATLTALAVYWGAPRGKLGALTAEFVVAAQGKITHVEG